MANFYIAYDELEELERGYSDHPDDPGGRTYMGITERDHPDLWENGPPSNDEIEERYIDEYWIAPGIDRLSDKAQLIANECFEACVLCGPANGVKFLQKAYNAMRPNTRKDLVVDGVLGKKTAAAVNKLVDDNWDWHDALLAAQNHYQGEYFLNTKDAKHNRTFIRGWFSKRLLWASGRV